MNDPYKTLAKAIFIILIAALAILVLPMLCSSCHTHKVVSQNDTTSLSVHKAAQDSIATASRMQWMGSLNLELDSFEIMLPYHFIAGNKMVNDSVFAINEFAPQEQPHRQANAVVLRGKHAVIRKADKVVRDESQTLSHRDTMAATAQHGIQMAKEVDSTAVAKPPNMDWVLTLAIVIAAAALLIVGYYKYMKKSAS